MTLLALTAAWMTALGIPVQSPAQVTVGPLDKGVAAQVAEGELTVAEDVMRAWRAGALGDIAIHELTHLAAWQAGIRIASDEELAIEEGVAQVVADDLAWPWLHRGIGVQVTIGAQYPKQAAWVRGLSAMGCRCPVDSRGARRWRWRFATGDRRAMIGAALVPPTEGVGE